MQTKVANLLDRSESGRKVKGLLYRFANLHAQASYSQEGEDRILQRLFENQRRGFYVDIGAHHPLRFSNTYLFYKLGWSGINIDAAPGSMHLFRTIRPRDCNLEVAVGENCEPKPFFIFDEPALNTFSQDNMREAMAHGYKVVAQQNIVTRPLRDILHQYLPVGRVIDFLSIDVEGFDLEVLHTNDWEAFAPRYILSETLHVALDGLIENEVARYLRAKGYTLLAKTPNTTFFRHVSADVVGK